MRKLCEEEVDMLESGLGFVTLFLCMAEVEDIVLATCDWLFCFFVFLCLELEDLDVIFGMLVFLSSN